MRLASSLAVPAVLLVLSACTQTGATVAGGGCAGGKPALAGHYYLQGVMEVGSELLLKPDGSFEFMLAYGANDQYGKGCWRQDGRRIDLVPAGRGGVSGRHTPDSRGFTGFTLEIEGRDLVWDIGGSGHRGRYVKGGA